MDEEERTVKIKTSCKKCIFARWEDSIQTGCSLDRLRKFESRGVNIETKSDDVLKYYEINTFCNACRDHDWADRQNDPYKAMWNQIEISLNIIILADKNTDYGNIIDSVKVCNAIYNSPPKIIFVVKNNEIDYNKLYQDICDTYDNTNFEILRIIDMNEATDSCIDMAVRKVTSSYYAVFDAGHFIPNNIIQKINCKINIDLFPVIMVQPSTGINGLLVQRNIHKVFSGNKGMSIQEKIELVAKEQDSKHMILTQEQLYE